MELGDEYKISHNRHSVIRFRFLCVAQKKRSQPKLRSKCSKTMEVTERLNVAISNLIATVILWYDQYYIFQNDSNHQGYIRMRGEIMRTSSKRRSLQNCLQPSYCDVAVLTSQQNSRWQGRITFVFERFITILIGGVVLWYEKASYPRSTPPAKVG